MEQTGVVGAEAQGLFQPCAMDCTGAAVVVSITHKFLYITFYNVVRFLDVVWRGAEKKCFCY